MSEKLADRETRFAVQISAERHPVQEAAEAFFAERVAAVDVRQHTTIRVERADGELVTEQIEIPRRKVKERADAGISLAVVITQVAFVITSQGSEPNVREQLPVIGEALVDFYFDCLVDALRIREAIRDTVGLVDRAAGNRIDTLCAEANAARRNESTRHIGRLIKEDRVTARILSAPCGSVQDISRRIENRREWELRQIDSGVER